MRRESQPVPGAAAPLSRAAQPLASPRLDPPAAVGSLCSVARFNGNVPANLAALRAHLERYQAEALVPLELPAIQRAFRHATGQEVRELIALDNELAAAPALRELAAASRAVGRMELRRLRPLRDQRLVRRYLEAIERGEAHGWHTLVYGVVLAVYSLPLRPGLLNYATQTMRGFVQSASGRLRLSGPQSAELLADLTARLPEAVNGVVGTGAEAQLRVL